MTAKKTAAGKLKTKPVSRKLITVKVIQHLKSHGVLPPKVMSECCGPMLTAAECCIYKKP
jgi:hypothetical protein